MTTALTRPFHVTAGESVATMGRQGQPLAALVHSAITPVKGLSAGLVIMPRGHLAKPHIHCDAELILYVLDGDVASLYGEDMTPMLHSPGSLVYIPPGMPHAGVNLSMTHTAIALKFCTDPAFNADVDLRPDLDDLAATAAAVLREQHGEALNAAGPSDGAR